MTNSDYIQAAAQELRPGMVAYAEDTYDSIRWRCEDPPSKEEVETQAAVFADLYDASQYRRDRLAEYPPLGDFADAIYWNEQGDSSKLAAYVAACEAVKVKYPKPEAA